MKVTIEGTQEQVESTLFPEKTNRRANRGEGKAAKVRARIAQEHAILANAFRKVRHHDREMAGTFLNAMQDLSKRTKDVLDEAERVNAQQP